MEAYGDAIGLTRLPGSRWEPYRSSEALPPPSPPPPKPARVARRKAKRQHTVPQCKAETESGESQLGRGLPHTLLGIGRRLLSWSGCPVPLTAVINREVDEQDLSADWVLVTTFTKLTANQIRSTCCETSASGISPVCTPALSRWW
jgi:hypothetical protein